MTILSRERDVYVMIVLSRKDQHKRTDRIYRARAAWVADGDQSSQ